MTFRGHAGAIYALEYDERYIYSASADKYVVRWNPTTQQQDAFAIKLPNTPFCLVFIDNNSKLVVGLSNGNMHLFDLHERKEIKCLQLHRQGVFAGIEHPAQQRFYIADGKGTLSVWNSRSLELLLQLPFNCGKIRKIHLSSDQKKLFLCCQDGKIRTIDTHNFNLINEWNAHNGGVGAIIELNQTTIVSAGKDAHIRVWDKHSYELIRQIPAHNYMIYAMLLLNDTYIVSASRDKSIKIWDTQKWKVVQRLDIKHGGHRHSVNQLIKINNHTFVSTSDDAQIIVWTRSVL